MKCRMSKVWFYRVAIAECKQNMTYRRMVEPVDEEQWIRLIWIDAEPDNTRSKNGRTGLGHQHGFSEHRRVDASDQDIVGAEFVA